MGPMETRLKDKITSELNPTHLELQNESHTHSVPRNSETHFRAVIVSEAFSNISRIERQRLVLKTIDAELKSGVHAFTMRCLAPEEWSKEESESFISPPCHGGSKNK